MSESVNPDHYKKKSIETFDAITSQLSPMENIGGLRWQILKYVMRMGDKHDGTIDACIMDIGKADWYLNKLLKYLKYFISPRSISFVIQLIISCFNLSSTLITVLTIL